MFLHVKYFILLVSVLFYSSAIFSKTHEGTSVPRNIIFFIGDGMGYNQIQLSKELLEDYTWTMTTLPISGTVFTRSANQFITDSAAAASALATGHKVTNHTLSQNESGKPFSTLLELFKQKKKRTGLVATTEIVDATPAAFIAHVKTRKKKNKIAEFFLTQNVDVILGGGRNFFLPKNQGGKREDGRNLIEELRSKGYQYVSSANELSTVKNSTQKLLGLFHPHDFTYTVDREEVKEAQQEPSLAMMTQKALELLVSSPKGFFVMIEGSRIDHAAHQFDIPALIQEMVEFDKAIKVALNFSKKRNDTLILVTADHETGGLTPSEATQHAFLRSLSVSTEYMAKQIASKNYKKEEIKKILEVHGHCKDLSSAEIELIQNSQTKEDWAQAAAVGAVIAKRAGLSMLPYEVSFIGNTKGHSSLPVPIFAFGPASSLFSGIMDNTEIPKKIAKATHVQLQTQ